MELVLPAEIASELDLIHKVKLEKEQKQLQEKKAKEEQVAAGVRRQEIRGAAVRAFNKSLQHTKVGDLVLRKVDARDLKENNVAFTLKRLSFWACKIKEAVEADEPLTYDDLISGERLTSLSMVTLFEGQAETEAKEYYGYHATDLLKVAFLPLLSFDKKTKQEGDSKVEEEARDFEADARATVHLLNDLFPEHTVVLLPSNGSSAVPSRKRKAIDD